MKKLDVVYTRENEILANEITGFLKSQKKTGFSLWVWALKVPILSRINELLTACPELRHRFESDEVSNNVDSALDLGCGFCVYWPFLSNVGYKKFVGMDLYSLRQKGPQDYLKTATEVANLFCHPLTKKLIIEGDVRNIGDHKGTFKEHLEVEKFDLVFAKNVDYKKLGSTGIPKDLCDDICGSYLASGGIKAYAG